MTDRKFPSPYDMIPRDPEHERLRALQRKTEQDLKKFNERRRQYGSGAITDEKTMLVVWDFYQPLYDNIMYVMEKVARTKGEFNAACKVAGIAISRQSLVAFRRFQKPLLINHVIALHKVTDLPMGACLMANIEALTVGGVIIFEGLKAKLHPNYFTDGVFFYKKYVDGIIPQFAKVTQIARKEGFDTPLGSL